MTDTSTLAAIPGPTTDERTLALLSHALSFVEGGILGPLLLYFLRKEAMKLFPKAGLMEDSEFVAFHSLQSLYFGLVFGGLAVVLGLPTFGLALLVLVPAYFIFELVACVKAHQGEWYQLPVVGAWAARQHPGPHGA
jgi:uncharacterized protein